ncbi:MAG: SPFH domain-containing protein [Myxococcales bacterium]|nr:SPFH domain-containing protein [Polyangiaceae bacterium]MDW8248212.1 SPFH domain-containing protein [Myxococcales bacterium]
MRSRWISVLAVGVLAIGCATQDIPQAHRGRIFGRTGFWALYQGNVGFNGPVLDPGTRFLGVYDEVRMLDCSMRTITESFDTMTKDGVHFAFTLSIRFSADCSDDSVVLLLNKLSPDQENIVTSQQIYRVFILPAIKEAAREYVSPYRANELNEKQAEVVTGVRRRFLEIMETRENHIVQIHEVNVGELKFPPEMDNANLERAVQSVMRDKAIAERERIAAEVEAMAARRRLAEEEAEVAIARIERIGAAIRRFPEYLQFLFANQVGEMKGTLVMAPPGFFNLNGISSTAPAPTAPPRTAPALSPPPKGK